MEYKYCNCIKDGLLFKEGNIYKYVINNNGKLSVFPKEPKLMDIFLDGISKVEFDKRFIDISEERNRKIDEIL